MQDAYAWALHRNGRNSEALEWVNKAMSLGTKNALFEFHAGVIKEALGDVAGARLNYASALAINPSFNALQAPEARAALARLGP